MLIFKRFVRFQEIKQNEQFETKRTEIEKTHLPEEKILSNEPHSIAEKISKDRSNCQNRKL